MAGSGGLTSAATALLAKVGELPPTERYVIALSGGADSAVAAWAVTSLAGSGAVRAVFVDHGLADSPSLGDAAQKIAAHLGLSLSVVAVDVAAGPNWESRARDARQAAVEGSIAQGEVIVTGHHADDQAETVLAHLLRGSGARGLAAMRRRAGIWLRPLLDLPRQEVRRVADEMALPYLDDPTNDDVAKARNRLRHEILPALETIQPGIGSGLVRSARHLSEDDDALEIQVDALPLPTSRGAWHVPLALMQTLPSALSARLMRRAVTHARPPYPPSAAELARLRSVAAGSVARTELSGGLIGEREGPYLTLYRPRSSPVETSTVVAVPGRVTWDGWQITADTTAQAPVVLGRQRAVLDGATIAQPWKVRAVTSGDTIDIGAGSKLVTKALAEAGIPPRLRPSWPVVVVGGKIGWLVGVRVARWCQPKSSATRFVVLGTRTQWRT